MPQACGRKAHFSEVNSPFPHQMPLLVTFFFICSLHFMIRTMFFKNRMAILQSKSSNVNYLQKKASALACIPIIIISIAYFVQCRPK